MTDLCIRGHYELAPAEDDEGNPVTVRHDVDGVEWWDVRPAEATYGNLCGRCFARIRYYVGQTPQLLSHIRSHVKPAMQAARAERVAGTRDLVIPINPTASDDSHDLYAMLANWMTSFARSLNCDPPVTLWESFQKDIDVRYMPVWAEQRAAFGLTRALANWYMYREAQISYLMATAAFHDELVEMVGPLMARYPQAPRKQAHTRARVCPQCDEARIQAHWVGAGAHDVVVECFDPETTDPYKGCGYQVPREQVDRYIDWGEW
ncbi:hypothetical protein [Subtercola sp. YIM 133946]|uniref:hypothetical protein n=1 Tax=Subtercola sp. YIM 133946 TaxID=3118909 RepID=UPI002F932686